MKQALLKNTADMLLKIEAIEKEVTNLKISILKKLTPVGKNPISLKGILKGVEVTEVDINYIKKQLYSKIKM